MKNQFKSFRVNEQFMTALKSAAQQQGVSAGQFIKDAVNAAIQGGGTAKPVLN